MGVKTLRSATAAGLTALLASCASYHPAPISPAQTASVLESRTLADPRLAAFLRSTAPGKTGQDPVWDLETLTLTAVYFHPDLKVADAKLATARAGVITARERPNPTLDLSGLINSTSPPLTVGFAVNLLLETFGKRGYRTEQARELAEAARYDIATTTWQVRGGVRNALLDLWAAQRRIAFSQSRLEMETQLVGLLERRLAVGEASGLDVARERVNRDQYAVAVSDAERAAATARAQLATAVGVAAQALEGVPIDLSAVDDPPRLAGDIGQGELRRQALTGRADVRSSLAQYGATQSALQLAIAGQYPNITLSPGYSYDQGDNKFGLSSPGLPLPVFNQNQGPIAEAAARRKQAAASFTALQAQIIGAIDTAAVAYRTAGRSVATTTTLLEAQQRRQARTAALFRAGQIDRPTLLTGALEVGAIQLSNVDAAVAQRQALGQLEDALRQPLLDPQAKPLTALARPADAESPR